MQHEGQKTADKPARAPGKLMTGPGHAPGKPTARRLASLGLGIAVIAAFAALPTPDGLGFAGKMALSLLVAGLALWVLEPIPIAITALGLMVLMPAFGILDFGGVWAGFISTVIFFTIATFGLTAALLKTQVPIKMVSVLLRLTKGRPRLVVLAFMASAFLFSCFMSDLACTAMFAGIAMNSFLAIQKAQPGRSDLGKMIMIGVAYGSVIGGQAIPSGSSMNIMAMGMLAANTGIEISFLGWSMVCFPIAVLELLLAWLSLVVFFRPEAVSPCALEAIRKNAQEIRLNAFDWKVLCILFLVFSCWFASNWTGWDTTAIAVFALVLFFVPGLDILTWKEFNKAVAWNLIVLVGGVQSLAAGIREQGAASWLFNATIGKLAAGSGAMLAASAAFAPLLRMCIPVGPAFVALFLIPLTGMADSLGVSAAALAIIVGVNASTCFMLPIDNNTMLTHRGGFWKMADVVKAGIIPTIGLMVLHMSLLGPLVALAGY
ncbi:MAG: anion permease [Coriobacteriaceae bacterium]|jgi:sodium-dependent dicarboxylate transporter 2/3/5|nr:anion permease [Coriobacteriaceae bacterium]